MKYPCSLLSTFIYYLVSTHVQHLIIAYVDSVDIPWWTRWLSTGRTPKKLSILLWVSLYNGRVFSLIFVLETYSKYQFKACFVYCSSNAMCMACFVHIVFIRSCISWVLIIWVPDICHKSVWPWNHLWRSNISINIESPYMISY